MAGGGGGCSADLFRCLKQDLQDLLGIFRITAVRPILVPWTFCRPLTGKIVVAQLFGLRPRLECSLEWERVSGYPRGVVLGGVLSMEYAAFANVSIFEYFGDPAANLGCPKPDSQSKESPYVRTVNATPRRPVSVQGRNV